jgi:glycerol-3-phosphate cytidylyltransferase-like family protein
MKLIHNTILSNSELKKEYCSVAYQYIKYSTDLLNSQYYYKKSQIILEQHNNVVIGDENGTNSNAIAKSSLSSCIDRIEQYNKSCSTTTKTDSMNSFFEEATLLKRKGDSNAANDAAKANCYLQSSLLYMKHCNKLMVNGPNAKKELKLGYKILRKTAKFLIASGKLFEQRSLWNETVLAFESSAALSLICSKENLSKMNMIRNTILKKSELKKEHRKLAYEYIKYTTDVLNSQHYYNKAQKILEQHKVVIVGYQNDTNSNDATVKSYLSMFADYNLSYYVDRIEHYYSEFSSAGI